MSSLDIINRVVGREGRYSNNPHDLGGETMWGITKGVARANGYMGEMKDMPRDVAVAIYIKNYVNAPGFNRIEAVSERIAEEMIDTGVNVGTSFPAIWLQRTLNVLNQQGRFYPDLEVDGKIGRKTVDSLKSVLAKRGAEGERVILNMLNAFQAVRYLEITEARPSNETFFYGWMVNRVEIT